MFKKMLVMMTFAMVLMPFIGNSLGECRQAKPNAEDLIVRIVTMDEHGKDIIREKIPEVEPLYNWAFLLTSDDYDYYDFGKTKGYAKVSLPYDGGKVSLATGSTHEPYVLGEGSDDPVIIDGGMHIDFKLHKQGKDKNLDLSILIPNKEGDVHGYGVYNYKFGQFEGIPLDEHKIILGGFEQYGDASAYDYLVFLSKPVKEDKD